MRQHVRTSGQRVAELQRKDAAERHADDDHTDPPPEP
jgi:hypothetical protein